jgi:diguanylate cyclase (GGDEF)-like protein
MVDHFKQVNDKHGHAIGDQVLLALSRILKQRLRKSDFVGRYGGEEFALVLPGADIETAKKL